MLYIYTSAGETVGREISTPTKIVFIAISRKSSPETLENDLSAKLQSVITH